MWQWFNKAWWQGTHDYLLSSRQGQKILSGRPSHWIMSFRKDPFSFLNSFSERSLDEARSSASLILGMKDYTCEINPVHCLAKISKLSMVLITSQDPVAARNVSTLRSIILRNIAAQREILVCSPLLCRRTQQALGCLLFMEKDNWLVVRLIYQLQRLVSFKFDLSQTLGSTVVRWAHCSQ